jgi:hypothetical protein
LVNALSNEDSEISLKRKYAAKRLVTGLRSGRPYASLSFSVALREVLTNIELPPDVDLGKLFFDSIGSLEGKLNHKIQHPDDEAVHNVRAFCAFHSILIATSRFQAGPYIPEWQKLSENYGTLTNSSKFAAACLHYNVLTHISEKRYKKYFSAVFENTIRETEVFLAPPLVALEVTVIQARFPSIFNEIVPEESDYRELWTAEDLYMTIFSLIDAFFPFSHPIFDAIVLLLPPGDERAFAIVNSLASSGKVLKKKCALILLTKLTQEKPWVKYIDRLFSDCVLEMIVSVSPFERITQFLRPLQSILGNLKIKRLVNFFQTSVSKVSEPGELFKHSGFLTVIAEMLKAEKKAELLAGFVENDSVKTNHQTLLMMHELLRKATNENLDKDIDLSDSCFKLISSSLTRKMDKNAPDLINTPREFLVKKPVEFVEFFRKLVQSDGFTRTHPRVAEMCSEIKNCFVVEPFGKLIVAIILKICLEYHDKSDIDALMVDCRDLSRCQKGFVDDIDEPGVEDDPRWQRVLIESLLSLVTVSGISLKDFVFEDFKAACHTFSESDVAFLMENGEDVLEELEEDEEEMEEDNTADKEDDDEDEDQDSEYNSDENEDDDDEDVSADCIQTASQFEDLKDHIAGSDTDLIDLDDADKKALESFDAAARSALKVLAKGKLSQKVRNKMKKETMLKIRNYIVKFAKILVSKKLPTEVLKPLLPYILSQVNSETPGNVVYFARMLLERPESKHLIESFDQAQLLETFSRVVKVVKSGGIDGNPKFSHLLSRVLTSCYQNAENEARKQMMVKLCSLVFKSLVFTRKAGKAIRVFLLSSFSRQIQMFWHFCSENIEQFKSLGAYRMKSFLVEFSPKSKDVCYQNDKSIHKSMLGLTTYLLSQAMTPEWLKNQTSMECLKSIARWSKLAPEVKDCLQQEALEFIKTFNASNTGTQHIKTRVVVNMLAESFDFKDLITRPLSNNEKKRQARASGEKYVKLVSNRKRRKEDVESGTSPSKKPDGKPQNPDS